jgi:citrate lyase subunit beta/citryl-CoA lyase
VTPRSYLYVPADRPDRIVKALSSGADAVIVDLEDAVAPAAKQAAREQAAAALADPLPPGVEIWVRVNPAPLRDDDVRAVAPLAALSGLCLAKVEDPDDVRSVDALLTALDCQAAIEPLIESARGVFAAREIAAAPRVRRLQIGEYDLAADLGATVGADERELLWARSALVAASAAAGLEAPVGPVSTEFRDLEALRASSEAVMRLGFWGRACIHPAQVAVVNEVFTPSAERVAWARDVVERLDRAGRDGSGVAVGEDGRLIDEAVARAARRVLARWRS